MPDRPLNPWQNKKVAAAIRTSAPESARARWLALQALIKYLQQGVFVSRTLDELFSRYQSDVRDRRFATELAAETIRRSSSLDAILANYVVRPRESVETELWLVLQMGVCQLLCLQHIPAHAAVHETVSLCEHLGKDRAKGFVNGTLRTIEREIIRPSSPESAPTAFNELQLPKLTPHQWPILLRKGNDTRVHLVELARKVFSDPQTQPLEYTADITGLPMWLLQRWEEQGMDQSQVLGTALWFTTPGRMALRVNLQKTTWQEVLQTLQNLEIPASEGLLPETILLEGSTSVIEIPGFQEGHFSVQDESAQQVTQLLNPQPGEEILDLCAAPGGKTCHIAERLQGTGRVVACDVSPDRLGTITHNTSRLQLPNVEVFAITAEGEYLPPGPFDAALVDVPCSNTGVLGKRPEARSRLTPASFRELIPLQIRLLNQAIDRVKPGGRVVYSTCSIDREENSEVVRAVLSQRNDVQLETEICLWPGQPSDGGYQALIRRNV